MTFYTSAEEMILAEFIAIMAKEGWIARKAEPDETEQPDDLVFEKQDVEDDGRFVAWQEGKHIGANSYPSELGDVVALYPEGTVGYSRVNGTESEEEDC